MSDSEELLQRIDRHINEAIDNLVLPWDVEFEEWYRYPINEGWPWSEQHQLVCPACRCDPLIDDDPSPC